jgi:hypothetical protein
MNRDISHPNNYYALHTTQTYLTCIVPLLRDKIIWRQNGWFPLLDKLRF